MRRIAATLAFFAALFVVAQPVCAAHQSRLSTADATGQVIAPAASQGVDHSDPCCSEIEEHVITVVSPLALPPADVVPVVPAVAHAVPHISRHLPVAGIPPPPPLSYHARSARIQR